MSDLQTASSPEASTAAADTRNAYIIYILYLAVFFSGITSLIGVVMAYVYRGQGSEWIQSHYRFQIRTFWIGLLYLSLSIVTTVALIGFVGLAFFAVWHIVRCIKGIKQTQLSAPIANPTTWLW